MKTLTLIPLLFCLLSFCIGVKKESTLPLNNQLKGKWKSERIQIQYVVDSHSVHEQDLTSEKGNLYDFDDTKVRVTYPDGKTTQGTYAVVNEGDEKKLELHLADEITTYLLISVTPTHMVWQRDLDHVTYTEGQTQKAAERAIYTEVVRKVSTPEGK